MIRELLHIAHHASLITEEGRFVRGSITFANPAEPDVDPPFTRRADYPGFTRFARSRPLTVASFVKLARAIDSWSASVAAWGRTQSQLSAWGIVDQLAQTNVRLNREGRSGFRNPGILTVNTEGIGDLSVYHGNIFLGAVRSQRLVTSEQDALRSRQVAERILPSFAHLASRVATAVGDPIDASFALAYLFESWSDTVARLCIGLRRLGTGGSLLFTPKPILGSLDISYRMAYKRLGDSMILRVLDRLYANVVSNEEMEAQQSETIPVDLAIEASLAETDADDRESELSGSVKVVTSLAAVDGLVLLSPSLRVRGFGVKIGPGQDVATVYDAGAFIRHGTKGRRIDVSAFGTRHRSMLRYCRADPSAIGVVVSQDGHVRVIMTLKRSLIVWTDVKLLGYYNYSPAVARQEIIWRTKQARRRDRRRLGYTSTPKTIDLLACAPEK